MVIGMLLLWILFNGRITLEILIFGIVICSAICLLLSMITSQNLFKIDQWMLKRICLPPALLWCFGGRNR